MKITFLSGGTGTPKLLQGFRNILDDKDISVICNNGDDFVWNGLYICPDLDTILYLFSGLLDTDKFWGVKDEQFVSLSQLKKLNAENTWFNVGDKDLALHILRTNLLKTSRLSEVTTNICRQLGIQAQILPMSDHPIQSIINTNQGKLSFQEFFVKYRTEVDVLSVEYMGTTIETTKEVIKSLHLSDHIIIGPSNPITSIGPIISIPQTRQTLEGNRDKTTLVSPIIGTKAFSGPTMKLMKSQNIEPSLLGFAKFYQQLATNIIIDPIDEESVVKLENLGYNVQVHSIELKQDVQKQKLARTILDFI